MCPSVLKDTTENDPPTLLAMVAHSAVQSSTRTLIHNVILFIDTATMFDTRKLIH